jgi:hypothetical protein
MKKSASTTVKSDAAQMLRRNNFLAPARQSDYFAHNSAPLAKVIKKPGKQSRSASG